MLSGGTVGILRSGGKMCSLRSWSWAARSCLVTCGWSSCKLVIMEVRSRMTLEGRIDFELSSMGVAEELL